MPPFHTAKICSGSGEVCARLIKEDVTEPSAHHDAERDIEKEVVHLVRTERRFVAGPELRLGEKPADIEPAQDEPGQVREPVPFDRNRADRQLQPDRYPGTGSQAGS